MFIVNFSLFPENCLSLETIFLCYLLKNELHLPQVCQDPPTHLLKSTKLKEKIQKANNNSLTLLTFILLALTRAIKRDLMTVIKSSYSGVYNTMQDMDPIEPFHYMPTILGKISQAGVTKG